MVSSQTPLLVQAKKGDAKAIATLLNQKLQPKGITVRTSVKNSCLHIMVEAARTPAQHPLVDFLQKSFASLEPDSWQTVKVYGRRAEEEIPDWVTEFKVASQAAQDPAILAKQGDLKAIATLINQKLQASGVVAIASSKNGCLQVMLEAAEVPNQEQMVLLLKAEIRQLEIQGISKLRLYGRQAREDFPDWQEEINLVEDEVESQQAEPCQLVLAASSKINEQAATSSAIQEVDGIKLSNQLYTALQSTCYQHLAYRVNSEDDKSIHEMVKDFVDCLESDLRLDLDQLTKQVVDIIVSSGIQVENVKVSFVISNVVDSNFTGIRLAIRDLERVTQEVLKTDFPQETDALKAFFSGAAQGIADSVTGGFSMSKEAMIGITIGSILMPGIGTAIGGAIGGWLGGNKQQKMLEDLIGKYQKARDKLFQEWEALVQLIYIKLCGLLSDISSSNFLAYETIGQANSFYNEGNDYVETDSQKAIELYDKAIKLNPGMVLAWNNKGYALNKLKKYSKAIPILIQAIQIDSTLATAFNNYGDALLSLGREEEARAIYEASIKLEAENYSAWLGRTACLIDLEFYQEAIESADKLTSLNSNIFLGWYYRATCYALIGNISEAKESLEKALNLEPQGCRKLIKDNPYLESLGIHEDSTIGNTAGSNTCKLTLINGAEGLNTTIEVPSDKWERLIRTLS